MAECDETCVHYYYQTRINHYIPSELGVNIIESSDKTIKPLDFNHILRLESIRDNKRVTMSNSRERTNPAHIITVRKKVQLQKRV